MLSSTVRLVAFFTIAAIVLELFTGGTVITVFMQDWNAPIITRAIPAAMTVFRKILMRMNLFY